MDGVEVADGATVPVLLMESAEGHVLALQMLLRSSLSAEESVGQEIVPSASTPMACLPSFGLSSIDEYVEVVGSQRVLLVRTPFIMASEVLGFFLFLEPLERSFEVGERIPIELHIAGVNGADYRLELEVHANRGPDGIRYP